MPNTEDHIVGIDIGSSKVAVLIGQHDENGELEVVGKGLAPNRGARRGNIVNVESTVEALKQACEEAEVMAGVEISRAYVGAAGPDVRSVNSRGMVSVARKDREINRQDIDRVLEAAQSAALPADHEILHAIPQEFIVDDQGGIADPLGMLGGRLEVLVHLVTGHATRSKTLLTCVNKAGIEVVGIVFEPLATAMAVLTPDEQELGVLLVDIGSGTTSFAYYTNSEVHHSAVLPIAAGHFTNDLAMVLRTPFAEAEEIKARYGCCLASLVDSDEGISVGAVGGGGARVVARRELTEILQPRAEEIFHLIREEMTKSVGDLNLRGGLVLTGGGAQLDGLVEIAEQVFDASARAGLPSGLGGLVDVIHSPTWSTAAGLLVHGKSEEDAHPRVSGRSFFGVRSLMGSVKGMFSDLL
ncbi:MAG: cell division protein FtsA [Acidobacteriota bacterium]|nr:cell division protein FtsA [Acidobacteriota bacterium]